MASSLTQRLCSFHDLAQFSLELDRIAGLHRWSLVLITHVDGSYEQMMLADESEAAIVCHDATYMMVLFGLVATCDIGSMLLVS